MNLYRFINSKDVQAHLQSMQYKFDSLEAAWLIYQCRDASIKEKHDAWSELIRTMPDCRIEEQENTVAYDSLHECLKDYMFLQKKLLKSFYQSDDRSVYQIRWFHEETEEWDMNRDWLFATYEDCMNFADERSHEPGKIVIRKKKMNTTDYLELTLRSDKTEMSIDVSTCLFNSIQKGGLLCIKEFDLYYHSFAGLCFFFPTPFERGDILWDPISKEGYHRGPLVLKEIEPNMTVSGYFIDPYNGLDHTESTIDLTGDVVFNYMNLEYYPYELKDENRIIATVRDYILGKIDEVSFVRFFGHVKM